MKINVSPLFSSIQGRVIIGVPLRLTWQARFGIGAAVLAVAIGLPVVPVAATASSRHSRVKPDRQPESKQASNGTSVQAGQQAQTLAVKAVDENGVVVGSARVTLTDAATQAVLTGETDYSGRFEFKGLKPGAYNLKVEREGFYAALINDLHVGETASVEITLNHQQEFSEVMDVVYSPPSIDPAKTAVTETLGSDEIVNLPYPTNRDIRNILPLMPGVVQDNKAQTHVQGSRSNQTQSQLDGFNVGQPVTGLLEMRLSADAVRSIDLQSTRYSAEYGKASGGVLNLRTGIGDDRYRFFATDFIPSVQSRKGVNFNDWTPRVTVSGPLAKQRAWFFDAADGEYKLNIVTELPQGADQNPFWRVSNLSKAQVNITQSNILTAGFLFNRSRSEHSGLSPFNPLETTQNRQASAYLFTLRDQAYLSNGFLLEFGVGINRFGLDDSPLGNQPYVVNPEGTTSGNFFRRTDWTARRTQLMANAIFPAFNWRGRHELKAGTDFDLINYTQLFQRHPILILGENRTLEQRVTFTDTPRSARDNVEGSGYVQDRWNVSDGLLVELGLRFDRDEIIHHTSVSPRVAASYLLKYGGETKITGGVGVFYDATNLDFITRPLAGQRTDTFFSSIMPAFPTTVTSFQVNERDLKSPRFINWSLGAERKLPASVYMRVDYVQKSGSDGFVFSNQSPESIGPGGLFQLTNAGRDRYHSVEVSLRHMFKGGYTLFGSYVRSAARSNALFDFSIDNPEFNRQGGGALPWDSPNRFISWGWLPLDRLPLLKKFDFAYFMEWRDGYPFSVTNQEQQLVGSPDSRRFPAYFSLNTHVERRFQLFGVKLAVRGGFDNITNRHNATAVNADIDSPQFLTYGGLQHRVFLGRIRFLGKK
jgi:hypothetical protein